LLKVLYWIFLAKIVFAYQSWVVEASFKPKKKKKNEKKNLLGSVTP